MASSNVGTSPMIIVDDLDGKIEQGAKDLLEQEAKELLKQKAEQHEMSVPEISVAVICMAIMQSYTKYDGWQEVLNRVHPDRVNKLRGRLYQTGYIMRSVATGELMLSSLGERTINQAMRGAMNKEAPAQQQA